MSGRLSSRMSIQSKRRLINMQSQDKRVQYANLYKDVAINKVKIQKDLNWLTEKLEKIYLKDPEYEKNKVNQSSFYLYGGSLLKMNSENSDSLVHSYLYSNLAEMVE